MKALELKVDSNSESDPKKRKHIIDTEPIAIFATTKVQPSESEKPEEGEHFFHSHMWAKGALLHFIVDSGIQNNMISIEVVKKLNLPMTPHS